MADVKQLIEQIKKGKVDPFRRSFDFLSFAEIGQVYEGVTSHFGQQRHFDFEQFKEAAEAVELSGIVIELGDHDGELARRSLIEFDGIDQWIGFDVFNPDLPLFNPKYTHKKLSNWFHMSEGLYMGDTFVSTHTLEHMSTSIVRETLAFVSDCSFNKMILEMPFRGRADWIGSKSLHIFNGFSRVISTMLKDLGWEIVYKEKNGMDHTWGAVR